MKIVVAFLIFVGILFIVQGYYHNKLEKVKKSKTIIKKVPIADLDGVDFIDYQFRSTPEKIRDTLL
tara:strand:- start:964 stop:1161 length:198 start_codon:yes stop_codon:yes gene_type:complete